MNPEKTIKRIVVGVAGFLLLILLTNLVGIVKIEGNEAVVRQDWQKGVLSEVWRDGTKFYLPITTDTYRYNIGTQKITFDDSASNPGSEYPRIVVNLGENGGQEAKIAISVNYRIGWDLVNKVPVFSEEKLIALHKDGIGKNYEDVILKRTVVDVVNKIARPNEALHIYSGKGFVEFKEAIDKELKEHPIFKERGIYIENTIVYKVYLDPRYEAEIAAKQQAVQTKLRKIEETKAAEEEARRVFAQSQAEVERRTQEAEAKKIEQIKAAEAEKEKSVLAAEAEKAKRILEAEGERDANLALASGVLAVGKAEAEVDALKREALYAGASGAWRAKVQIATAEAEKLKGIFEGTAIVPEKTVLMTGGTALSGIKPTLDMN